VDWRKNWISPDKSRLYTYLVGGFNPSEKYWSKWESSPNSDENRKCLKPPTSYNLNICVKTIGPTYTVQNQFMMDPGVWKKPTNRGCLKRFVQKRCGCEHNWTTATKATSNISLPRTDPWLPGCILLVDFDGKLVGKYTISMDCLINENLRMAYYNPYRTG